MGKAGAGKAGPGNLTDMIPFLSVFALLLQVYCQARLVNSPVLSKQQKRLNSILLWVLPVVWAIVLLPMLRRPQHQVTIKKHRKPKYDQFYESGKAGSGGQL